MNRMKAILTLTATLAFVLSPFANDGFNGFAPDQFPIPQNDPPAQPAGYAFGIWGLIYIWLLAGTGFGLLKRAEAPGWDRARWPLFISLAVGAAWIPVAQISPIWATVLIWVMLGSALIALLKAGRDDRIWLRTPIALYAGWLTAAACVALALVLAGHGILGEQVAALLSIGLALALGMAVQILRADTPEYALAVIWALTGIIIANLSPPNIAVLSLCGAGIAALTLTLRSAREPADNRSAP
ncbi:MAG: hypothetical protein ACQEVT_05495 [Pseudomonadota bacterium]|uniref:hypothetical protein n=1 Tax=Roseovarius TaxID=74030 RepID=UPI0022A77133|nr:hypothetical protein [Roseovarius sp. EGI FJ00037]MCZ0810649.1 hypothetical protein [Roseovarius sp. EGI FJ00037]